MGTGQPRRRSMDRRYFMLLLAAGATASLTGCQRAEPSDRRTPGSLGRSSGSGPAAGRAASQAAHSGTVRAAELTPSASPSHPVTPVLRSTRPLTPPQPIGSPRPGRPRVLDELPATTHAVALTVDDGVSSEVVAAYAQFAATSGARITFFPNGIRRSWTEHAALLRPMVESGQVQLGNHTWSHPRITELSDREIGREITRNEKFLNNTFGVSGGPFFRPPYGAHNSRTDRVAADLGYPDITLWYGDLQDYLVISESQLMDNARRWLTANRIVIGHANHPAITHVYGQLTDLLRSRNLETVTLRDAFCRSTS